MQHLASDPIVNDLLQQGPGSGRGRASAGGREAPRPPHQALLPVRGPHRPDGVRPDGSVGTVNSHRRLAENRTPGTSRELAVFTPDHPGPTVWACGHRRTQVVGPCPSGRPRSASPLTRNGHDLHAVTIRQLVRQDDDPATCWRCWTSSPTSHCPAVPSRSLDPHGDQSGVHQRNCRPSGSGESRTPWSDVRAGVEDWEGYADKALELAGNGLPTR